MTNPTVVDHADTIETTSDTSHVVNAPSATPVAGDQYLVFYTASNADPTTITAPDWDAAPWSPTPFSSNRHQWAWSADATLAPSFTFVTDVASTGTWGALLIRGSLGSAMFDSYAVVTSGNTAVMSITAAIAAVGAANCLLLAIVSSTVASTGSNDISPDASMAEVLDTQSASTNTNNTEAASKALTASGGTGDITATRANNQNMAMTLVAIAPAPLSGAAALSGGATLTSTASVTRSGAVALTASASLAASGLRTVLGAVALSGTASLSADGNTGIIVGAVALSAGAGLVTDGQVARPGAAEVSGNATLSAAGVIQYEGSASLSAQATLSATGERKHYVRGLRPLQPGVALGPRRPGAGSGRI